MPAVTKTIVIVESNRARWVKRLARADTTIDRNMALEVIAFCDELLAVLSDEAKTRPEPLPRSDR